MKRRRSSSQKFDDEDLGSRRVCTRCVDEPFLKELIRKDGKARVCSYCDRKSATFSLDQLADQVERAFEDHYERTSTDPEGWEDSHSWERSGEPVVWAIANAASVSEEIATDLQSLLEDKHRDIEQIKMGYECPFDSESCYEDRSVGDGEFAS